mmetsp:Transcript_22242/g.36597  ORF Transcript_22242/g.36597 Transcript_22242/m.36597 type:complete len:130 (+) Transcript_22242:887-1276(+)
MLIRKMVTNGMEQSLGNILANDVPLKLPRYRHAVMPSSQSHRVGRIQPSPIKGNGGGLLQKPVTVMVTPPPLLLLSSFHCKGKRKLSPKFTPSFSLSFQYQISSSSCAFLILKILEFVNMLLSIEKFVC